MMISITETTRRLHIGKRRLYEMLESEGITPTLKSGHKLLDQNQFDQLSAALQGRVNTLHDTGQTVFGTESAPDQHRAGMAPGMGDTMSSMSHEAFPDLMKRMTSEIEHLRQLLANEQSERREERQERENYQQILMVLQGDMKQLRQQLLEAPTAPTFSVSNPVEERDTPVEFTEAAPRPEPVVGMGGISSGRALGVTAFVALIAVIWVTMTNPESPLREAIASLWQ